MSKAAHDKIADGLNEVRASLSSAPQVTDEAVDPFAPVAGAAGQARWARAAEFAERRQEELAEALRGMLRVFSPHPREDTEGWRDEHEACEEARRVLEQFAASAPDEDKGPFGPIGDEYLSPHMLARKYGKPAPASAPVAPQGGLAGLRAANINRQAAWCPDQIPDLSFRGNELAGETGEVCNVIKKLERERLGWRGSRDTVEHLAEELADVVICADLVAISAGIDLDAAVVAKFNATSEEVGLPQRLAAAPSAPAQGEPVAWAVERWKAEVANRPLRNIHRRTLDDTWRQVIRHYGGDPDALCGPSNDDLLAASPPPVADAVKAERPFGEVGEQMEWVESVVAAEYPKWREAITESGETADSPTSFEAGVIAARRAMSAIRARSEP